MNIFEIISAIILIIACVFIVVVVLMKDTKTQMSQSISGTTADSFFQKNAGRTKDAMLNKATIVAVIVFFVLALAVNVINVYWSGDKATESESSVTSIETVDDAFSDDSSEETSSTASDTSSDETSSSASDTSSDTSSDGTSSTTSE
ncbi:MAG: preprotein translocase subunit SecG [Oscillospiraceae bacterium]